MAYELPATYYVIYYDNLGTERYDSGYLYKLQLFDTVKEAQQKIDTLVAGRLFHGEGTNVEGHYSVRKVKLTLDIEYEHH
jgi:hypothetical protein